MKSLTLSLLVLGLILCSSFSVLALVYQDPELDAIVIDDEAVLDPEIFEPSDEDSTTTGPAEGFCSTTSGAPGTCLLFNDCFPYAKYLIHIDAERAGEIREFTTGLDDAFNTTGSCPGSDLICCPSFIYGLPTKRPSILPQFTRPPGAGRPTQSTTTSRTTVASTTVDNTAENATTTTTTSKTTTVSPGGGIESKASCGIAYATVPKVVGGREANKGEFPWAVAMLNNGRQFCGGSLINERYILTAAHCVQGLRQTSGLKLNIGDHDIGSGSDGQHETRGATKILYHRGFSMSNLKNDIALIQLSSPVKFSSSIQPICLSRSGPPYGKNVDLAGWGKISNSGPPSKRLRTVSMKVITMADCQKIYQGTNAPPLTSGMVCAGDRLPAPLRDACNGDSGGPLTYTETGTNSPARQVGVVSWGIGCGEKPGVYTAVNQYIDWIQKNSK